MIYRLTAHRDVPCTGKSTLLDVLAGRKNPKKVEGTILLDGKPVDRKSMKDMSGYVQQEDLVMGKNGTK